MNLRQMSEFDFNQHPARPRCQVTGALLTQEQFINVGRFATQAYKALWKEHAGNLERIQQALNGMILCPLAGYHNADLRTWQASATRRGFTVAQIKQAYETHFQPTTRCKFPGCEKTIPFEHTRIGACSVTHHNISTKLKRGDYRIEDLKFVCAIDGMRFSRREDVGDYLRKTHKYTDAQMEAYYRKHCLTSEYPQGACLQCGSPTRFQSVGIGYARFCHNTGCSVLWENANTDRLVRSAVGIKLAHSTGESVPSQLGYWLKKGLSQAEAEEALRQRQTNNSVAAIAKRKNCTLPEAQAIRKTITEKWSTKTHTGQSWSKSSQKLFWEIWEQVKDNLNPTDVFFATFDKGEKQEAKNLEFRFETKTSFVKFDFYIIPLKLVIEFDGEWYHAKSGWGGSRNDAQRDADTFAIDPLIFIHRVRERDWIKSPKVVIQTCTDIINARLADR